MPELVFLGRHPILHPPATLTVARGRPIAAMRAYLRQFGMPLWMACFATFQAVTDPASTPGWVRGCLLVAGLGLALHVVMTEVRDFVTACKSDSPFLTMDGSGLVCSLPKRRAWPWWDVKACACRNEKGRRVLRVFLDSRAKLKVDLDFSLAAEPKRALDEAMVACVAWIVAAREPSETESPVREFVDEHAASRKVLYRVGALCVAALIVLGVLRSL